MPAPWVLYHTLELRGGVEINWRTEGELGRPALADQPLADQLVGPGNWADPLVGWADFWAEPYIRAFPLFSICTDLL